MIDWVRNRFAPSAAAAASRFAVPSLRSRSVIVMPLCRSGGFLKAVSSGWKGFGPVPWSHEPNRGFLRALAALQKAAAAIGEVDEAERCRVFLSDSDPEAAAALGLS